LPGWLRKAIAQEKENCRKAGVFHTQTLLELRGRAYAELNKGNVNGPRIAAG
jgi:hypothetical protein